MFKKERRIQLAIVFLVGMFILGGTLLNIANGGEKVHDIDIDEDGNVDVVVTVTTGINKEKNEHQDVNLEDLATFSAPTPYWYLADDLTNGGGSIYVGGTRIDDEGNEIGKVSVHGGISVYVDFDNFTVTSNYWAYAFNNVSDGYVWNNHSTWVQVPGKNKYSHPYSTADSTTYVETIPEFFDNLGDKVMGAYAMISTEGARIEVKFKAEGQ